MFFLLRVAFWLSIVVLFLPAPADPRADPNKPQVSTLETLGAAKTAFEDARGFCARKPEACRVRLARDASLRTEGAVRRQVAL